MELHQFSFTPIYSKARKQKDLLLQITPSPSPATAAVKPATACRVWMCYLQRASTILPSLCHQRMHW